MQPIARCFGKEVLFLKRQKDAHEMFPKIWTASDIPPRSTHLQHEMLSSETDTLITTGQPEHKLSAPRWKEDRRSWPPSPLEARRSLFHSPWRIFPVEECENFFSIMGWDWVAAKRQTNLSIVFQKICSHHQRQGEKCPLLHTVLCHKRGSRVPIIECTTLVISLIYLTVSQPNKWVNH